MRVKSEATRIKDIERVKVWLRTNPDRSKVHVLKWMKANPEKVSAHQKVYHALSRGWLVKQPCEICGSLKSEAHHEDYSMPLLVRWLCRQDHKNVERGVIILEPKNKDNNNLASGLT